MRRAPAVKGQPRVGRVLKVTKGKWSPRKVTLRYQWGVKKGKRFVALKHGKKARLKVTRSLRGKRLRVRVIVRAKGHERLVHFTAATPRVRRR